MEVRERAIELVEAVGGGNELVEQESTVEIQIDERGDVVGGP